MHLEAYNAIRDRLDRTGFTPEIQTQITLFTCACKAVNLPFLAMASSAPATSIVWQAANSQLFRESEAMSLLMRVTRWSMLPLTYARSAQLTAPIYGEAASSGFTGWPLSAERASLEAVAFGHALLAKVRLTPIIPQSEAETPYAVALMRIEQENGRLLQTQIRLLKDGFTEVDVATREAVIARKTEIVDAAFAAFLEALE